MSVRIQTLVDDSGEILPRTTARAVMLEDNQNLEQEINNIKKIKRTWTR